MSRELSEDFEVYIKITVDMPFGYKDAGIEDRIQANMRSAQQVINDIKRHVDGMEWIGIEQERNYICSHCYADWTERDHNYNGGCCEDDDKEGEKERL